MGNCSLPPCTAIGDSVLSPRQRRGRQQKQQKQRKQYRLRRYIAFPSSRSYLTLTDSDESCCTAPLLFARTHRSLDFLEFLQDNGDDSTTQREDSTTATKLSLSSSSCSSVGAAETAAVAAVAIVAAWPPVHFSETQRKPEEGNNNRESGDDDDFLSSRSVSVTCHQESNTKLRCSWSPSPLLDQDATPGVPRTLPTIAPIAPTFTPVSRVLARVPFSCSLATQNAVLGVWNNIPIITESKPGGACAARFCDGAAETMIQRGLLSYFNRRPAPGSSCHSILVPTSTIMTTAKTTPGSAPDVVTVGANSKLCEWHPIACAALLTNNVKTAYKGSSHELLKPIIVVQTTTAMIPTPPRRRPHSLQPGTMVSNLAWALPEEDASSWCLPTTTACWHGTTTPTTASSMVCILVFELEKGSCSSLQGVVFVESGLPLLQTSSAIVRPKTNRGWNHHHTNMFLDYLATEGSKGPPSAAQTFLVVVSMPERKKDAFTLSSYSSSGWATVAEALLTTTLASKTTLAPHEQQQPRFFVQAAGHRDSSKTPPLLLQLPQMDARIGSRQRSGLENGKKVILLPTSLSESCCWRQTWYAQPLKQPQQKLLDGDLVCETRQPGPRNYNDKKTANQQHQLNHQLGTGKEGKNWWWKKLWRKVRGRSGTEMKHRNHGGGKLTNPCTRWTNLSLTTKKQTFPDLMESFMVAGPLTTKKQTFPDLVESFPVADKVAQIQFDTSKRMLEKGLQLLVCQQEATTQTHSFLEVQLLILVPDKLERETRMSRLDVMLGRVKKELPLQTKTFEVSLHPTYCNQRERKRNTFERLVESFYDRSNVKNSMVKQEIDMASLLKTILQLLSQETNLAKDRELCLVLQVPNTKQNARLSWQDALFGGVTQKKPTYATLKISSRIFLQCMKNGCDVVIGRSGKRIASAQTTPATHFLGAPAAAQPICKELVKSVSCRGGLRRNQHLRGKSLRNSCGVEVMQMFHLIEKSLSCGRVHRATPVISLIFDMVPQGVLEQNLLDESGFSVASDESRGEIAVSIDREDDRSNSKCVDLQEEDRKTKKSYVTDTIHRSWNWLDASHDCSQAHESGSWSFDFMWTGTDEDDENSECSEIEVIFDSSNEDCSSFHLGCNKETSESLFHRVAINLGFAGPNKSIEKRSPLSSQQNSFAGSMVPLSVSSSEHISVKQGSDLMVARGQKAKSHVQYDVVLRKTLLMSPGLAPALRPTIPSEWKDTYALQLMVHLMILNFARGLHKHETKQRLGVISTFCHKMQHTVGFLVQLFRRFWKAQWHHFNQRKLKYEYTA